MKRKPWIYQVETREDPPSLLRVYNQWHHKILKKNGSSRSQTKCVSKSHFRLLKLHLLGTGDYLSLRERAGSRLSSGIRHWNKLTTKALERGKITITEISIRCYSSLKVLLEVFLTNDFFLYFPTAVTICVKFNKWNELNTDNSVKYRHNNVIL